MGVDDGRGWLGCVEGRQAKASPSVFFFSGRLLPCLQKALSSPSAQWREQAISIKPTVLIHVGDRSVPSSLKCLQLTSL